ncbi:hypothetical protein ONS95_006930 [Cadophora gregata]|uniref:uncharacterized protein n=1 Tax=Cadophora gregata TaxID=51156 RepID=UPI0026DB8716|nr:uncharacterized protein ONS95_006930 [Cadophora gregata]KAK0101777.1 hypothetical protein ONS95_006930 [Cadophora gregata]
MMKMRCIWLTAALVPSSLAITLLELIGTTPELSTLYSYVNGSANAANFLASSNNFTFLAPNNDAISALIQSKGNATLTEDLLLASVQYGMVKGGFPTLSFSNNSQFVSTNLAGPKYANVTGGQTVELVTDEIGNPQVVSGNKVSAGVADELICTGGIVHIIDKFLSIPIQTVLQVSAAKMQYFVSILNTAGYLNTANSAYVDGILNVPDVTYFIPNSAIALEKATRQAANSTAEETKAVFQYHVVPGFVGYSSMLKDGMRLKTQEGSSLTITMQDGDMYVNSAKIIASDYIVANGVIHVIDDLLDRFNNSPRKVTPTSTSSSNLTSATSESRASEPASTPSTSEPSTSANSGGLSTGTKIAIGVGSGAGGLTILAVLAVIAGCLIRRRKQKTRRALMTPPNRDSAPSPMESFYVQGGTIHKKDDGYGMEYKVAPTVSRQSSNAGGGGGGGGIGGPEIPPRSPGRTTHRGGRGGEDSFF